MLYLASRSPRRHHLLARLGIAFSVLDSNVPEIRANNETTQAYVERVAMDKARAGLAHVQDQPHAHVLAADTEVVLDDRVYGKPANAHEAAQMLASLSNRTHQVITSVVLATHLRQSFVSVSTEVTFAQLNPAQIAAYVATGEPLGKAGAYAIQGRGECFVRHLAGSYSAVVGLPLYQTAALLNEFGLRSNSAQ